MVGTVSDQAIGKDLDFKHFACETIREETCSMSNRPCCYLSTKNDVLFFSLTHFSVCGMRSRKQNLDYIKGCRFLCTNNTQSPPSQSLILFSERYRPRELIPSETISGQVNKQNVIAKKGRGGRWRIVRRL